MVICSKLVCLSLLFCVFNYFTAHYANFFGNSYTDLARNVQLDRPLNANKLLKPLINFYIPLILEPFVWVHIKLHSSRTLSTDPLWHIYCSYKD